MRKIDFFILIGIFYSGFPLSLCEEADYETDNEVVVLTDKNFDIVVNQEIVMLVEFYAPWCGHCKKLAPEYEKAAGLLKDEGIKLAKVDATVEQNLGQRFDVSGYPTLKLFKSGDYIEDFDGDRNSQAIVTYMRERADPNYVVPPPEVEVLTESNFDSFVDQELCLVEFYAPWCGHCKKLAPEYEKAASELKPYGIRLGKVDATVEKELAKKFSVTGYPTLLIFRKGRSFTYKGPRERFGIAKYMRAEANPPSRIVDTPLEAKNALGRTDPVIFAAFSSKNSLYREYISAANSKRGDFSFIHTFDSVTAGSLGLALDSINVIQPDIYHSKYEEKINSFINPETTADQISEFITKKSVPLLGQRHHKNQNVLYSKKPILVVYYDVDFSHQYVKATQLIRQKILPVAQAHRDITFALSDEDEYGDELKSVGLDDSGEEINVALFDHKNVKYRMDPEDEFSVDLLTKFVESFKNGKLKPYLKSQPIPKRQEGAVRVLVAKNFDKEVSESGKDYLIEFYAPWCGHCKKLEPIYKKVAKHFSKDSQNVVVAKMDATANDVPSGFDVEGFPTIFFVKAGHRDVPVKFEGNERTFEGFKKFVEKHKSEATTPEKEEL